MNKSAPRKEEKMTAARKKEAIQQDCPWESGQLGMSEEHVRVATSEEMMEVDVALGLQPISIRLQKGLLDALKAIAKYHGIGYQPMIRDLLNRFAISESKEIYQKLLEEAKRKESEAGEPTVPVGDFMRRIA
ncbi:hypothetical protein [Dyella psychrodurans]|nr:hypothetical protein [Dyella psychrodurans]